MGDRFDRVQNDIDVYGLHVIIVPEDEEGPSFAYSIGLYRTLGHPEVIIFGLEISDLHAIVNQIAAEVRGGTTFGEGDVSHEILQGNPVAFRNVSAEFYEDYLGQAIRYYGGTAFPAIQCFWPDREGHFPWQVGYGYGTDRPQPQLQLQCSVAVPPWPFDQEPNVAAVTSRRVLEGHPILRVVHYLDDHSWAFTCGTTDNVADGRLISMAGALKLDRSIVSVADLPPGWGAWRESVASPWQRYRAEGD